MDFLLGGMSGVCAGFFSNPFDVSLNFFIYKFKKISFLAVKFLKVSFV